MHCSECGAQLINNPKFCSNCGHAINDNAAKTDPSHCENMLPAPQVHTSAATASLGTKWLKFWNYFCLPFGGILGLLLGLLILFKAPVFGFIMISISYFQLVVADGLHRKKLWAWRWNWVLIISTYISMAIPSPRYGTHSKEEVIIVTILGGLIWMWPNYVYWKKRIALFS